MHVLHVPYAFAPDPVGGTEVYVQNLAGLQQQRGLRVTIAAPGAADASYRHDGLAVERFAIDAVDDIRTLYGAGDAGAAARFAALLDRLRPDLVHLHALTPAVSKRLVAAARAVGARVVLTYHTPSVSCLRGTLLRWGDRVCDGALLRHRCTACTLQGHGVARPAADLLALMPAAAGARLGARGLSGGPWTALRMTELVELYHASVREVFDGVDHVVAVCDWVRELLLRNGVAAARVTLSRQGIAHAEHAQTGAPAPREAAAPVRLAFLGRLDAVKGADLVVRALRAVPALAVELDLYGVVQGESDRRHAARVEALAAGDPRIRLQRGARRDEVLGRLRDYDALVVPSQWLESGPLVVLEAFAAGVPVLGSNLGGIAEIVRDNVDGLLVEATSVPAWSRALHRVAADRALLARLRAGVRPPRSMGDVAADMDRVYEALIAERR